MEESKTRRIVLLTLINFTLLLIFLILICVVLATSNSSPEVPRDEKRSLFQFVSYNDDTKISTSGMMTLSEGMKNEIKTYSKGNEYIMISSIGENQFKCSGTCFCNTEKRNNAQAQVLRNGIVYLLTALTSVIAYKAANDYFHKECLENFSNLDCEGRIESKVDHCLEMTETKEKTKKAKKPKWYKTGDMPINPKTFQCKGGCELTEYAKGKGYTEDICSKKSMNTFNLDCWDIDRKKKCKQGKCVFGKNDFVIRYLEPHCEETKNDEGTNSLCTANKDSVECRLIGDTDDAPHDPEEPFNDGNRYPWG